jgi:uncharacterized SAM-binding protein YcdF (DUF218 family)
MSFSSILQWIGNNLQIIIFVLVFAAPAIGKVLKNMSEARQKRLAKLERERAEIDALRTGGRLEPVNRPLAEPSANQRAQQAAEERRRQAEAAQRAAAARRNPSPTISTAPTTMGAPGRNAGIRTRQVRLPGGIVLEVPDETSDTSPQTAPQPVSQSQAQAQAQRARREKKARTPARPAQPSAASVVPEAAPIAAYAQTAPATSAEAFGKVGAIAPRSPAPAARSRGSVTFMGQPQSRDQLRKAIVLAEVFGRPAAERL